MGASFFYKTEPEKETVLTGVGQKGGALEQRRGKSRLGTADTRAYYVCSEGWASTSEEKNATSLTLTGGSSGGEKRQKNSPRGGAWLARKDGKGNDSSNAGTAPLKADTARRGDGKSVKPTEKEEQGGSWLVGREPTFWGGNLKEKDRSVGELTDSARTREKGIS